MAFISQFAGPGGWNECVRAIACLRVCFEYVGCRHRFPVWLCAGLTTQPRSADWSERQGQSSCACVHVCVCVICFPPLQIPPQSERFVSMPSQVGGQTDLQSRTQFSLWAVLAAPLLISSNLLEASPYALDTWGETTLRFARSDCFLWMNRWVQVIAHRPGAEETVAFHTDVHRQHRSDCDQPGSAWLSGLSHRWLRCHLPVQQRPVSGRAL
jgi:hypothetical protein